MLKQIEGLRPVCPVLKQAGPEVHKVHKDIKVLKVYKLLEPLELYELFELHGLDRIPFVLF